MNCEILDTLYVRSNGDIPCNDDAGEEVLLGRVEDDPSWSIVDVFENSHFAEIRGSLSAGRGPWPQCGHCAWLRSGEPFNDQLADRKVRKVQVEPSLRCPLRCPGCSNQVQSATRPRPHLMALNTYSRLLDSLAGNGYQVAEIEYCGQGEPLVHPKFSRFVSIARGIYPGAYQRLITNGNADYAKATGRQGVDEIYVSCDGARQESYEQYRIGGRVERALRFLADAPRVENGVHQRLIWKYILFEFNDSTEEIEQAQHMAQELEVEALLFVLTHSCHRSERWVAANMGDFPILYPNVVSSVTPVQDRDTIGLTPLDDWKVAGFRRSRPAVSVESITAYESHVDCSGWASLAETMEAVEVKIDGRPIGNLRAGLPRSDLAGAHPAAGFRGRIEAAPPTSGTHRVELVVSPRRGRPVTIRRHYRFGTGPADQA